MTRPHFTPTVITDVNGKTTTVHKRTIVDHSAGKKLPPPTPKTQVPTTAALLKRAKEIIEAPHLFTKSQKDLALDDLSGIARKPLSDIVDLLGQKSPIYNTFATVRTASDQLSAESFEEYAALMKQHCYRLNEAVDNAPDMFGTTSFAHSIIRGLQFHKEHYEGDTNAEQGVAIMDAVAAILHATESNEDYPEFLYISKDSEMQERMKFTINSTDLLEYVMDHPNDTQRLSDIIHANPNLREGELLHLLTSENTSAALIDGAL